MKIYITGCARSGTTLLQFLMWAFEDTAIIGGEQPLDVFSHPEAREQSRDSHLVAKRTSLIFGGEYPPELDPDNPSDRSKYRDTLLDNIRMYNLRVLDIIRDPRDVLTSRHHSNPNQYYVKPDRWLRQVKDIDWLSEHWDKVTRLRYESLLRSPDKIQSNLADNWDLTVESPFSDYPTFVPEEESLSADQVNALKGIRSIEPQHIGRWQQRDREYILELARSRPEINEALVKYDYENSENWHVEMEE